MNWVGGESQIINKSKQKKKQHQPVIAVTPFCIHLISPPLCNNSRPKQQQARCSSLALQSEQNRGNRKETVPGGGYNAASTKNNEEVVVSREFLVP